MQWVESKHHQANLHWQMMLAPDANGTWAAVFSGWEGKGGRTGSLVPLCCGSLFVHDVQHHKAPGDLLYPALKPGQSADPSSSQGQHGML